MTDLNNMSLEELKALEKEVGAAIKTFEARKLAEARDVLTAKAKELGVSIDEVFGVKSGKVKTPVAPKYRHPENPSLTWSGRGRQPDWFKEAIEAGADKSDLLI
ncbi:trans-acting regulatory protein hvrA [Tritonibacter mobilis]|uniref:Transcriptional regulator n=2 Tax=Tritonibacter mobilis TaxID=379347 RepID=A0A1B1A0U7_9RHOB|nr:H-NS histone family protein [Tritonibacter mobilis]ANP40210.1 transcriptional regulator [Tritonibacter mobilis F1926]KJZ25418.1 trans-acting regulatory protein hvrA [Tritonibacter mobilis]